MLTANTTPGADEGRLRVHIQALFEESIAVKRRTIEEHCQTIASIATVIHAALGDGGKVLLCGNGGSAADAQHLAAEMLIRLRPTVNRRPYPFISLAADTSSLTACGNDYGFEEYYARLVEALGRPGDVLLAISTSGRSPNVVRALEIAQNIGLTTIGLLGGTGEPAARYCDMALVVPSKETGRVQETHITVGHAILECVEDLLIGPGSDVS